MVRLSVIILSYNTKNITERCLRRIIELLEKTNDFPSEIIVIDNDSKDGSKHMLERFGETVKKNKNGNLQIKTIYNDSNVGYPKGNNQGVKYAAGDYILFLNSDVLVEKVSFKRLCEYLDTRPDVGVLTVKVRLPNGNIDPASHRGFPTIWNSICYFLKLEKFFGRSASLGKVFGGYHQTYLDFRTIHEIDSPTGAFYLTRKNILQKVNGFDENFFMYGEDLDLSFRIKELGYKVVYYPLFHVLHYKYASGLSTGDPAFRRRIKMHFFDAMKIFYQKHYEKKHSPLVNKLVYFVINLKRYFN